MDMVSLLAMAALVNALWQYALIFVSAYAAAWLLRRSPARQYAVWLAALLLCCVAPWASLRHYHGGAGTARAGAIQVALQPRPQPLSLDNRVGQALLAAYLLSMVWAALRTARQWRLARRIVANASPVSVDFDFAGASAPRVVCSSTALSPFLFGFSRPVLVLPESVLESGSEEVLRAVLWHETAHLRRKDCMGNVLVACLFPLVAFHPCAHAMRERLREARELACDDLVAASFVEAPRYAASLLDLALRAASAPIPEAGVGSVHGGSLERRIRRLMTPPRCSHVPAFYAAMVAIVFLLADGAAMRACSFQFSDPHDYTGVWRQNWSYAFRPELRVDRSDCCFSTLEIRYQAGQFAATLTGDTAGVEGNRVVRGPRRSHTLSAPVLSNGILSFRTARGATQEIYEVTLGENRAVLVRHSVPPAVPSWQTYAPLK